MWVPISIRDACFYGQWTLANDQRFEIHRIGKMIPVIDRQRYGRFFRSLFFFCCCCLTRAAPVTYLSQEKWTTGWHNIENERCINAGIALNHGRHALIPNIPFAHITAPQRNASQVEHWNVSFRFIVTDMYGFSSSSILKGIWSIKAVNEQDRPMWTVLVTVSRFGSCFFVSSLSVATYFVCHSMKLAKFCDETLNGKYLWCVCARFGDGDEAN